ncbi:Relaxase/Mobilisation nuclease domain-containing protein [Burkholderia diffusa]|nr:Relaxase/Mobilisation nuclease domain-containing protein [Burkholderia diffusa]
MKAVADANPRVGDAVYHVVISWPSDEAPTDDQAFSCARHTLGAVGMAGHQYVFAVHRDTDNTHVHIAVNRVNPDSFVAVSNERDFFKLDRAMRELELEHGWAHDAGPFAVFERNGKTVIDWASKDPSTKGKKPAAAADMERHADEESLFTYARGEPRKALLAALRNEKLTWQQLHNLLAKFGLAIREKGQGFAIYDLNEESTTPIKASDMHEELSKTRLTRRLGVFEESTSTTEPTMAYDRRRPVKRDPVIREERRQARADARRELRARYDDYKNGFVIRRLDPDDVRDRFAELRDGARRRRLEVRESVSDLAARKALYSVIAFETVRARAHLQLQIKQERERLRSDPNNRRMPYREWVEKQAAGGDAAAIGQLRGFAYSDTRRAKELERALADNGADGVVAAADTDPTARNVAANIDYRVQRDGTVIFRRADGREVFVDYGRRIAIVDTDGSDDDTIAAALRLAAAKYGGAFDLTGSEAFKRRALSVMVSHKIEVRLNDRALEALRRDMAAEQSTGARQTQIRRKRIR